MNEYKAPLFRLGARARRQARGRHRSSRRRDDDRRTDGVAGLVRRGICPCLRQPPGDPRGHRPHPCQAADPDQRGRGNRLFSADDGRIATPARARYIIAMTALSTVRLQREPFDAAAEAAKLTRGRTDVGALVTFTGICRGDEAGEPIAALALEYYPGMAEAEIERTVAEAVERWPLQGVTVIHRHGRIGPGEDIMMVATASSHRQAAFAAAEFLMDYLKTRAPFWKQVEKAGGKIWVDANTTDDAAAERWAAPNRRAAE